MILFIILSMLACLLFIGSYLYLNHQQIMCATADGIFYNRQKKLKRLQLFKVASVVLAVLCWFSFIALCIYKITA